MTEATYKANWINTKLLIQIGALIYLQWTFARAVSLYYIDKGRDEGIMMQKLVQQVINVKPRYPYSYLGFKTVRG